ncbi:sterile alpha motif domain-containing protein 1-like isoform X2 [Scylla paramamosain]|uniref:sterile alpha motif domain-containing protein 1-like isoform X2 n=1 Tax=Scylla paramamosain TaxID=85552 RepID=UPI003083C77C
MFLVVEFCQSQEVVVIPELWTSRRRSSTLWPPYQSAVQLNEAIRSQEAPSKEWVSHAIRTIHTADSYSKARRKMIQIGRQWTGGNSFVAVRRSERLKRAASQHSEAQEGHPAPKRRRTSNTQAASDAPTDGTAHREPPPPPQPARKSLRVRRPPPQAPPQQQQTRRSRRTHPPSLSSRRSQHPRPRPSPPTSRGLVLVLARLHKSLNKQIRYLNVVLRLLNALKKYVMLQEILAKLPDILDGIMERVSLSDQVPYMERIPELVVREIIWFVQREAEVDSEDEEEEPSVPREE